MNIFIHCLLFFLSVSNATSKSTQQPLSFNDDRLIPAKLRGRRLVRLPSLSRTPAATHHLNHQPGHPPGIPPPRPPTAGHHPPTAGHHPPTAGHHPPTAGHPPKAVVEHKVVVEPGRPVIITPTKLREAPPLKEFPAYVEPGAKNMRIQDDTYNTRAAGFTYPKFKDGLPPHTDLLSQVPFTQSIGLDIHYSDAAGYSRFDTMLQDTMKKKRGNRHLLKKDLKNIEKIQTAIGKQIHERRIHPEIGKYEHGKRRFDVKEAAAKHAQMTGERAKELSSLRSRIEAIESNLKVTDQRALMKELKATKAADQNKIFAKRALTAEEARIKIANLEKEYESVIVKSMERAEEHTVLGLEGRKMRAEAQELKYKNLQEVLKLPREDVRYANVGRQLPEVKRHYKYLKGTEAPNRYLNIEESIGKVVSEFGKENTSIGSDHMQYLFEDFLTVRLGANSAKNNHQKSPFEEWNREVSTAELAEKLMPNEALRGARKAKIHFQDRDRVVSYNPAGESLDMFNTRLKQEIMEEYAVINGLAFNSGTMSTAKRIQMVDDIAHLSEILDVMPYAMTEFNEMQARINARKMADEIKMAIKYHFAEGLRISDMRARGKALSGATKIPDVFNVKSRINHQEGLDAQFGLKYGEKSVTALRSAMFAKDVVPLLAFKGNESDFVYKVAERVFNERIDINIMNNLNHEHHEKAAGALALERSSEASYFNLFPSQTEKRFDQHINKIADDLFNKFIESRQIDAHYTPGVIKTYPDVRIPIPVNVTSNSGSIISKKAKTAADKFTENYLQGFPTPPPKKAT